MKRKDWFITGRQMARGTLTELGAIADESWKIPYRDAAERYSPTADVFAMFRRLDAWKERVGMSTNTGLGWLPNGNLTERVRTSDDVEWDYYRSQHKDRAVFFRLGVRFYVHRMERRSDAIKGTIYLREVRYL